MTRFNCVMMRVSILLMAMLWLPSAHALEPASLLSDAQSAFLSENYAGAVERYETLLQTTDIEDARVYANLGAAYAKLGQSGEAVWAYQMAQRLAPRDATIAASAAAILPTDAAPLKVRWVEGKLPPLSSLTTTEVTVITALLYLLMWGIALGALLKVGRHGRWRWISVGVMLIWTTLAGPRLYHDYRISDAVTIGDPQTVYSNFSGGRDLFTLPPGTTLARLQKETFTLNHDDQPITESWTQIKLTDGRTGWVKNLQARELRTSE